MDFFIRKAVIQVLDKFVETDFGLVLNLFSSGNTINLENVQLKKSAIPSSFPVKVVQGILGKVSVALPLFHLATRNTEIFIEDVSVVLEFKEDNDVAREDLIARLRKRKDSLRREVEAQFVKQLASSFVDFSNAYDDIDDEESRRSVAADDASAQGSRAAQSSAARSRASEEKQAPAGLGRLQLPSLPGFVKNLLGNIKVHIGNVHVRIEQAQEGNAKRCEAVGICLQALDIVSCAEDWRPGRSPSTDELLKIIRIHRFGCYVESEAPRARVVPFTEVRHGRTVRAPTQLVSYFPHTWLLEPISVTLRLSVRNCWPAPPKPYRPEIFLRVFVSPLRVHLHSVFIRTLAGMVNELDAWKQSIEDKVRTMDALNARNTMSAQEHAARCRKYRDLYSAFVRLTVITHGTKAQKKKCFKALRAAEAQVHLDDLASIWLEVLHEVHEEDQVIAHARASPSDAPTSATSSPSSPSDLPPPPTPPSQQQQQQRARAASAHPSSEFSREYASGFLAAGRAAAPSSGARIAGHERMKRSSIATTVPRLASLSTWEASPPASPSSQKSSSKPSLSRMFSVSQLNEAQRDQNESLRFAALAETSFAPHFDISACVEEVELRVSLSKFSDNACVVSVGSLGVSLRDHSAEDIVERHPAHASEHLEGRLCRPDPARGIVVHALEARALRKAQAAYLVVAFEGQRHRTKTFSKASNPIWNQNFHLEIPALEAMRRVDVDLELWVVRDLHRDELVGSATLSLRTKHLRVGEMVDRWVDLSRDAGSVHICIEEYALKLPFLQENAVHVPQSVKSWPGRPAPTIWVGFWLGKLQLRSIATIETLSSMRRASGETGHVSGVAAAAGASSARGNRSASPRRSTASPPATPSSKIAPETDKRTEVRDIALLRIDEGTSVLVIVDRASIWAKTSAYMGVASSTAPTQSGGGMTKSPPSTPRAAALPAQPPSSAATSSRPATAASKISAMALAAAAAVEQESSILVDCVLRLGNTMVLFSRWQILFLLNQFHELYLGEQSATGPQATVQESPRGALPTTPVPPGASPTSAAGTRGVRNEHDLLAVGQRLKDILASNLQNLVLGNDEKSDTSSVSHEESRRLRPWHIVDADSLPFKLTCRVFIGQAKAGFTWGDGSVTTSVGRAGEESKSVTYLVATEAHVSLHTYMHDESLDVEALRLTAKVGSIGVVDSKRPDRPVVTRENHRNTDFFAQAAPSLPAMVKVVIHLPYGWAYSLNFDDRRAISPPEELGGSLLMEVEARDLALETPALQYTLPALLGGIMPLVKLIEVPPLPSIAVQEVAVQVNTNVIVYLAESIDSVFGSRAFYALFDSEAHYTAKARESREDFSIDSEVGFGMCRLSRNQPKSRNPMRRRRSSAEYSSLSILRKDTSSLDASRWKVSHRILSSVVTNIRGSLSIDANGEATTELSVTAQPIVIYFWIQDMALLCAILLNFVNDGIALGRQMNTILRFELPVSLQNALARNAGKAPPDHDVPYAGFEDLGDESSVRTGTGELGKPEDATAVGGGSGRLRGFPSRPFVSQREGSGLLAKPIVTHASADTSGIAQEDEEADEEETVVMHAIAGFPLVQLPFQFASASSVRVVTKERFLTMLAIIGHDDSPVLRFKCSLSWLWRDPNMTVGAQIALSFFNLKKAGWEPVIEPWHVHGTVVMDNTLQGPRKMKFKGAGVLAEEVMDIDVSEEFVTTIVSLCLQGIRFLDHDSQGLAVSFYPMIDDEKKHRHGYELWNLTGEPVLYQPVYDEASESVQDARARDVLLECASTWDLNTDFEILPDGQSAELGFWTTLSGSTSQRSPTEYMEDSMLPKGEAAAKAILGNTWTKRDHVDKSAGTKKKRFIRLKFDDYDTSLKAYLIRIDRVGDYALRLGNGNMLRVSVGTRNGLVHKIKLLSMVSVANRTGRDVWLSRTVNEQYMVYPLHVLRTLFCPLIMTDDELSLEYTVETSVNAAVEPESLHGSSVPLTTRKPRLPFVSEENENEDEQQDEDVITPSPKEATEEEASPLIGERRGSKEEVAAAAAAAAAADEDEDKGGGGGGEEEEEEEEEEEAKGQEEISGAERPGVPPTSSQKKSSSGKFGSRKSILGSSGAKLNINLRRIPDQKQTFILEVGDDFVCAVEFEFRKLESMALWNYLESGKRRDKKKVASMDTGPQMEVLRPRWAKSLGLSMQSRDVRERRAKEKDLRMRTLQAVQIVLKPLFAVSNLLPVPLLVSSVRRQGPRKDPQYVAPGGRYICDDTHIEAVQFKVPTEDSEWSLPIPLHMLAPADIANRLRFDRTQAELGPTLSDHLRLAPHAEEVSENVLQHAAQTVNAVAKLATDTAVSASRGLTSRMDGETETVPILSPSGAGVARSGATGTMASRNALQTGPGSGAAAGLSEEREGSSAILGVRRLSTEKSLQDVHLHKRVVPQALRKASRRNAKSHKMKSKKMLSYGSDMAVLEAGRATHEEELGSAGLAKGSVKSASNKPAAVRSAADGNEGAEVDEALRAAEETYDLVFPLARRVHPDTLRCTHRRHVISVRVIETREVPAEGPAARRELSADARALDGVFGRAGSSTTSSASAGVATSAQRAVSAHYPGANGVELTSYPRYTPTDRMLTLMFRQRVIATRQQSIELAKNRRKSLLWEETINFMFDNILQNKAQVPKKLYIQYISVGHVLGSYTAHTGRLRKILGIGCIDLADLLMDFSRGKLRRQKCTVTIQAMSGTPDDRTLVENSKIAEVDIDVRVLTRKAASLLAGSPGAADKLGGKQATQGAGHLDGEVVRDLEPDTDDEEFEVLSQVGSEVDSDVESLGSEDDSGDTTQAQMALLGNMGFVRAFHKFGAGLGQRRKAEQEVIQQALAFQETLKLTDRRLTGPSSYSLEDHADLSSMLREHDSRRGPLSLRCRVSSAMDAGFRLSIHAPMWFQNESSVEAVVQSLKNGASTISVVPSKRSLLLETDDDSLQLALHRFGDKLSNVMPANFVTPSLKFKFKDFYSGRELLNASHFVAAVSQGAPNTLDTRVVKLWHSIYISNKTNVLLEIRATGPYRRMGSFILHPDLERAPWHYGSNQMQIRSRTLANPSPRGANGLDAIALGVGHVENIMSETVPSSDWSGLIDLNAEAFQDNYVSLPVALFDTDGLPVRIVRIVLTRSKQAATTRFISFEKDDPPTYVIQNRSLRTVVVSQKTLGQGAGADSLSVCESVLRPGYAAAFGWAEPSQDRPQILVRMVLSADDKAAIQSQGLGLTRHVAEDLSHAYKLSKVGKLKSCSIGDVQMHVNIDVLGSSRLVKISCEGKASYGFKTGAQGARGGSRRPPRRRGSTYSSLDEGSYTASGSYGASFGQDAASAAAQGEGRAGFGRARVGQEEGATAANNDSPLLDEVENQYSVAVHVLEAQGIGPPKGQPAGYPRVIVHCGMQSSMTPEAEPSLKATEPRAGFMPSDQAYDTQGPHKLVSGRPVGDVRWVHAPIRFGFDVVKPGQVRFEVVQPIVDGMTGQVRNDRVGSLYIPIGGQFHDSPDIAKIAPDWQMLHAKVAAGHQGAQLRVEIYLLSNMNARLLSVPRMLRVRMKGFGLSIINSARRREDLYGRVSGIDLGIQIRSNGRVSTTLRVGSLQVDNNQPLVQNRVCIVPTIKDVSLLELHCVVGLTGSSTLIVDTLKLVMQSMDVKIDEKFLDAILGVSKGFVKRKDELAIVLRRAKASINGTFEGKRSTSYEFMEDLSAGETAVLMESDDSGALHGESVHRFFAGHSLQTVDIASEVDRILQSHVTVYVRDLHIYPIKITLSFFFQFGETDFITQYQRPAIAPIKGVIAGLGKWSDVIIRCGDVRESALFADPIKIARQLGTRYAIMLSKQSWKGIAALEILGNPQHFIERVVGSLARLSTAPVQVFRDQGLERASVTLGDCVASVMCTCVAAPLQLTWRVTGSMATILEGTRPIRHLGLPLRMLTTALQASQQGVEFFDPMHESVYPTRRPRTFNEHGLYEPIVGSASTGRGAAERQTQSTEAGANYWADDVRVIIRDDDRSLGGRGEDAVSEGSSSARLLHHETQDTLLSSPSAAGSGLTLTSPFDFVETRPQEEGASDGEDDEGAGARGRGESLTASKKRRWSRERRRKRRQMGVFGSSGNLHFHNDGALHAQSKNPDTFIINVFDQNFEGLSQEAIDANLQSQFQINHSIHLCIMCIPGLNIFWFVVYILHCIGILQWF